MTLFILEAFVVILVVAWVYFAAKLGWFIGVIPWAMWRVSRQQGAAMSRELASLSAEQIRERLLADSYFDDDIRADLHVASFLRRIADRDEALLRREFTKGRLYRMLVRAERAAGRLGRPEAVDAIYTLNRQLDELTKRARVTP